MCLRKPIPCGKVLHIDHSVDIYRNTAQGVWRGKDLNVDVCLFGVFAILRPPLASENYEVGVVFFVKGDSVVGCECRLMVWALVGTARRGHLAAPGVHALGRRRVPADCRVRTHAPESTRFVCMVAAGALHSECDVRPWKFWPWKKFCMPSESPSEL